MNVVSHGLHLSELSNANAVQSQSSMTLYRVNITYTYFYHHNLAVELLY